MSNIIPIVYASDSNGINQLSVSIYSLLKNRKPDTFYEIHILTKDFSHNCMDELEKITNFFGNCSIDYMDCKQYEDKYDLSGIEMGDRVLRTVKWPSPTYYRLLIPIIFKDKSKVMYLDIDTLILKDLWKIFSKQIDGYCAGVPNFPVAGWIKWMNETLREKGQMDDPAWVYKHFDDKSTQYDQYIQAGMLIFNIQKWQSVDFDKFFQTAHECNFNDEDALNHYCKNDFTILPTICNYCLHFVNDDNYENFEQYFKRPMSEFHSILNEVYLIHFSARKIKPDYVVNETSIYLIERSGGFENFMNLLDDFDMYSMIYDLRPDQQYVVEWKLWLIHLTKLLLGRLNQVFTKKCLECGLNMLMICTKPLA